MLHALAFKQCAFVIECLEDIKKYDDEWKQRRDYCLFKATDIMRWLKAGTVPVRGNPNNSADQEKFDVEEGNEERPVIRQSTKGGSGGKSELTTQPNLGLPSSDEDEKKSESEDSDEKPKASTKRPAEPSKRPSEPSKRPSEPSKRPSEPSKKPADPTKATKSREFYVTNCILSSYLSYKSIVCFYDNIKVNIFWVFLIHLHSYE